MSDLCPECATKLVVSNPEFCDEEQVEWLVCSICGYRRRHVDKGRTGSVCS